MARLTWDGLKAAFADNTSGDITAGDMRDFVDSVSGHVAAGAPGTGNDASEGFDVGAVWVDVSDVGSPVVYVCVSNTVGAAVWTPAGGGGDSSGLLPKAAEVNSYAGNRTLGAEDSGAYVRITASGTVTLPDGLDTGFQCVIVNATAGATVELAAATTLTLPAGYEPEIQNRRAVTVVHVGSNVWEVHGALVETS